MQELMKGRAFQLWEYHVSHGSLLIRSPADTEFSTSTDLIFVGVEYLEVPRHFGEIVVSEPNEVEIERLKQILGKELSASQVWVFEGSQRRSVVVAVAFKIQQHLGDIFESPFSA